MLQNLLQIHVANYKVLLFLLTDVYPWIIVGVVSAVAIIVSVILLVVYRRMKRMKQNSMEQGTSVPGKPLDEPTDVQYYEEYLTTPGNHTKREELVDDENKYINIDLDSTCHGREKRESSTDPDSGPQYENQGMITSQEDEDPISDQEPQYENTPSNVYSQLGPHEENYEAMYTGIQTNGQ